MVLGGNVGNVGICDHSWLTMLLGNEPLNKNSDLMTFEGNIIAPLRFVTAT